MSSTCFTWSLRQLAKLFCLASITPYLSVRVLFQGKHFLTFSTFSSLGNLRRCTMCLFSNILCFFSTQIIMMGIVDDSELKKQCQYLRWFGLALQIIEDILQKRHLLWEGVYELCHFIYRWGFFTLRWEHFAVTLWLWNYQCWYQLSYSCLFCFTPY